MSRWTFPALLAAVALTGCESGSLTTPLASRESRDALAAQRIREAVEDMGLGDAAGGRSRIDSAVAILGRDNRAKAEVARRLVELGRPDAAERLLQPLLNAKPGEPISPLAWGVLAMAARKQGDKGTESRARTRAEAAAAAEIARFGERPKDDQARAETIRRLLDLADYHELPGVGQPAKAIAACREALEVSRQSPIARSRLARVLATHGTSDAERDEAVQMALDAILYSHEQDGPNVDIPDLMDAYGWALAQRGKKDDLAGAQRVLREAADLSPEDPEIRYHLAMAYLKDGLGGYAEIELSRALLLRPDYPDAEAARREMKNMVAPAPTPSPEPPPASEPVRDNAG